MEILSLVLNGQLIREKHGRIVLLEELTQLFRSGDFNFVRLSYVLRLVVAKVVPISHAESLRAVLGGATRQRPAAARHGITDLPVIFSWGSPATAAPYEMNAAFPNAVPEIPVTDIDAALDYYRTRLGFEHDWGDQAGGIAGISRGDCRLFLTNTEFREHYGNAGPVVIWLNLGSKEEVDALYETWRGSQVKVLAAPESKPWGLHEFIAVDPDGNFLRVFYDFATTASSRSE